MAQQLYDGGEKTVAQIAAIFKVPRSTVYGHLDKATVGARPRGRVPAGYASPVSPAESGSRSGRRPAVGAEVVKV